MLALAFGLTVLTPAVVVLADKSQSCCKCNPCKCESCECDTNCCESCPCK